MKPTTATNKANSKIPPAITVLSCIGIAISSISLYHHYGTSASSFCDFGNSFNCDMVNRSVYSSVAGIPVALLGIVGYAALMFVSTVWKEKWEAPIILLFVSLGGLVFALYLTYIEAFVLAVWCLLCLGSLAVMAVIAGLSVLWAVSRHRKGFRSDVNSR